MIVPHSFEIALVNGKRDSRLPFGLPALAGTTMADLAASCVPGRTIALGGAIPAYSANWAAYHIFRGTNDADTWMGIGYWDRQRKLALMYGDRTAGTTPTANISTFSLYTPTAHQWTHLPLPEEIIGVPHVYCRSAYDDSRGHFYRTPRRDRIHRYSVADGAWQHIAVTPPGATTMPSNYPCMYHEALDMLIVPDGDVGVRKLWGWSDGDTTWTEVSTLGLSGYHGQMIYNRTRGDALFVEGNTGKRVRLIQANGAVVDMPPFTFATVSHSGQNISYDPVGGNYLVREGFRLWELNPEAEEWRLQTDWGAAPWSADWPGNYFGRAFNVIDDLGVLLWQTYYGPRLYKPASAF